MSRMDIFLTISRPDKRVQGLTPFRHSRDPGKAEGFVGARTSSVVNELSRLRGSERYAACEDDGRGSF